MFNTYVIAEKGKAESYTIHKCRNYKYCVGLSFYSSIWNEYSGAALATLIGQIVANLFPILLLFKKIYISLFCKNKNILEYFI